MNTYELTASNPIINFINFTKQDDGTLVGGTSIGVSVHSKLHIELNNDSCNAWIHFNSIRDLGTHNFLLDSGSIHIDKTLLEKDIIKASFHFTFANTLDSNVPLFWKGLIYSEIKQ